MYFTVIFTSLFISAILFTSCNSNDSVKQADATTVQSLDSAIATKVNGDDAQFAAAAASGGMMEVEMVSSALTIQKILRLKNLVL